MTYEEKRQLVIDAINEARKYRVGKEPIRLSNDTYAELNKIVYTDLYIILCQLEHEKAIEIVSSPSEYTYNNSDMNLFDPYSRKSDTFEILILDYMKLNSAKVHLDNGTEVIIGNVGRRKDSFNTPSSQKEWSQPTSPIKYFINYTEDRRVLLNGEIELARPDFNSVNDVVFKFLYENPNKIFTRKGIVEATKKPFTKELRKIPENLGFNKGLKKLFFEVSQNGILFRNNLTQEQVDKILK